MGWGTGTDVFTECMEVIQSSVSDDDVRKEIYEGLIDVFERYDWDGIDEVLGIDHVFDEIHMERFGEPLKNEDDEE